MQNAVDAIADPQLVLRGFEVNVRGAVLEGLPDDLVDELDDTGFLVALGDLLVLSDQQLERFVLGEFIERLGADAVVFFERLLDFHPRGEGKLDRTASVKAHGIEHGRVERIADGHLQDMVREGGGQHQMLESDFG